MKIYLIFNYVWLPHGDLTSSEQNWTPSQLKFRLNMQYFFAVFTILICAHNVSLRLMDLVCTIREISWKILFSKWNSMKEIRGFGGYWLIFVENFLLKFLTTVFQSNKSVINKFPINYLSKISSHSSKAAHLTIIN